MSQQGNLPRPLVIYHDRCPDGFASAWVAHRKFGGDADYLPAQYGQEPPAAALDKGRALYILDFSYPRDVLFRLAALRHEEVIVLDHHKSAEEALRDLDIELVSHNCGDALTVRFDMGKSGARLTWEHFFPDEEAPWLVDYTEARDLWTFHLPYSREISAALASFPFDFSRWDEWEGFGPGSDTFGELVEAGVAILRYQGQQVEAICANAREVEIGGHKVLAANTSVLSSEVAGRLAEGRVFGAAWFVRSDGKKQVSLRSTPTGVDVSEVAKAFGGGGHARAAGFEEEAGK